MKLHRRQKFRIFRKKIAIILFGCIILFSSLVVAVWYGVISKKPQVISPLPQGVFRILPKTEDQKKKEIEAFFAQQNLMVDSVTESSESGIIVSLKDNGDIYMSDNYAQELPSLQLIISKLTMEGKRFKRLDLRFERPIIVL